MTVAAVVAGARPPSPGVRPGPRGRRPRPHTSPGRGSGERQRRSSCPRTAWRCHPTERLHWSGGQDLVSGAGDGSGPGSVRRATRRGTGRRETPTAGDCLELPDDARVGSAAFSPDGSQVVLCEDFVTVLKGRMWLVGTADGSVQEVGPRERRGRRVRKRVPDDDRGDHADTRRLGNGSTYYMPAWDRETGGLFVLEFGTGDNASRRGGPGGPADGDRHGGRHPARAGVGPNGCRRRRRRRGDDERWHRTRSDLAVVTESDGATRPGRCAATLMIGRPTSCWPRYRPTASGWSRSGSDQRQFQPLPPMIVPLDGGAPTTIVRVRRHGRLGRRLLARRCPSRRADQPDRARGRRRSNSSRAPGVRALTDAPDNLGGQRQPWNGRGRTSWRRGPIVGRCATTQRPGRFRTERLSPLSARA